MCIIYLAFTDIQKLHILSLFVRFHPTKKLNHAPFKNIRFSIFLIILFGYLTAENLSLQEMNDLRCEGHRRKLFMKKD
jgi:hypothetical protein